MFNHTMLREIAKENGWDANSQPALFKEIERSEEMERNIQRRRILQSECEKHGHHWSRPSADGRDMGARCINCGAHEE